MRRREFLNAIAAGSAAGLILPTNAEALHHLARNPVSVQKPYMYARPEYVDLADHTAWMQALINLNDRVDFPFGVYRLKDQLNITCQVKIEQSTLFLSKTLVCGKGSDGSEFCSNVICGGEFYLPDTGDRRTLIGNSFDHLYVESWSDRLFQR